MYALVKQSFVIGFVCLAWVYPFANEPIASAEYQIIGCAIFALISLVCLTGVRRHSFTTLLLAIFLIAVWPNGTLSENSILIAAMALAFIGFNLGSQDNQLGFTSQKVIDCVLWGTLLGAIVNALEGVLQYLGLAGGLWPWVPESLLRGVAYGVFRQPNLFATLLCCGIACVTYFYSVKKLSSAMSWTLIVVLQVGVAASSSRIGVVQSVAFLLMGLVWTARRPSRLSFILIGQAVTLLAAATVLPYVAELHGFEPRSLAQRLANISRDSRLAVWSDSIYLIGQEPFLGWGWQEFGYAHFMSSPPDRFNPGSVLDNAHNFPLQIAVEFGLPVAILLTMLLAYFIAVKKPWRSEKTENQVFWLLLLSITLHSMVEFPLWYPGFIFLASLAFGVLLNRSFPEQFDCFKFNLRSGEKHSTVISTDDGSNSVPGKIVAFALILFCGVAWWQYARVATVYAIPARNMQDKTLAIRAAQNAWLFADHVAFSNLTNLLLDETPAEVIVRQSERLLHFSAEPRVIQSLIFGLWQQRDYAELQSYSFRYCVAFPVAYSRWVKANASLPMIAKVREHEAKCPLNAEVKALLTGS